MAELSRERNTNYIIFLSKTRAYACLLIRILVMGMPTGCCKKITAKIHVDGIFDNLANNCPDLRRLEIGWDSETLRFSDKSSKVSLIKLYITIPYSRVMSLYVSCIRLNFYNRSPTL